jgi:hypothetical protein
MKEGALLKDMPEPIRVNRSELRQHQSSLLRKAKGDQVLLITAPNRDDEKYIMDRARFDQVLEELRSFIETLEITMDLRLFNQILASADMLDENLRLGKLHSIDEAFADE